MTIQYIRSNGILASAIAVALSAGCASAPAQDATLQQAQAAYASISSDPKVAQAAPEQLRQASANLDQATTLEKSRAPAADVDHYARLSLQQVAIARQLTEADASQAYIKQAGTQRSQVLLTASQQQTQQAQLATQNANIETQQARQATQDANAQNQQAQTQAAVATAQADQANQQNAQLQQQLDALNAKQTDRGLVLTLGSVLFDTDQADLKSGSDTSLDRLGQFMRDNPKRNVMIEGYTDSSGNADSNLGLSTRRAAAVRSALISGGLDAQRTVTRGFGSEYPVASNATASGRQQNRRVEIVISDVDGHFPSTH